MNIAGLVAFLNGDLENAKTAMTPGGIEAQERCGQVAFVANETLPVKCGTGTTRQQLEAVGIVYGDPVDDLFVAVQLPEGWQKVAENHATWSKLVDDKGRERASMFYEAAFYDRNAFINIRRRYIARVEPVSGWDDPDYKRSEWYCIVYDDGVAVWTSDPISAEPEYHGEKSGTERDAWMAWIEQKDALAKTGESWLDEHYPDWRDPVAYWD